MAPSRNTRGALTNTDQLQLPTVQYLHISVPLKEPRWKPESPACQAESVFLPLPGEVVRESIFFSFFLFYNLTEEENQLQTDAMLQHNYNRVA